MNISYPLETAKSRIQNLINRFGGGMANGPFVQKKEEMLGQEEYLAGTKEFMFLILDKFEKMV